MGQKYSVVVRLINSGSSAIPHLGHDPGLLEITSGSMGQKYFAVGWFATLFTAGCAGISAVDVGAFCPNCTRPVPFESDK
jgi:hypothetical protein